MRLSTFFFNENNKTGECTIVMLSGNAGGLESNVRRWMGQLNLVVPSDDSFAKFLESQQRITTNSGYKGVVVDFTSILSGDMTNSKTSISAMIEVDGSTVFVKLVGDKSLLLAHKSKFIELCLSIQSTI